MPKGLLMVAMQPAAGEEEEFQDWYDTEHVPERAAIDGFLTAQRYVCTTGWPRYLATYDLRGLDVLGEPGYLAISGAHFSPWSKRVLGRMQGLYRVEGLQVHPGDAVTGGAGRFPWLTLWRFRGAKVDIGADILSGLNAAYGRRREAVQTRLFRSTYDEANDHVALVETRAPGESIPLDMQALGRAGEHLDMLNHYVRYWRHGRLHGVLSN